MAELWAQKNILCVYQPLLRFLREAIKLCPIDEKQLYHLLEACRKGDRAAQDQLYTSYFPYCMGVCLRYSRSREEAIEILNDGFIKIFTKLHLYSPGLSFKGWIRKVMINSSIDYFRRNEKHYHSLDISHVQYESGAEDALDHLSEEEIIAANQLLPPSYRMVFNLFVIEGYKHEEIANQLNISVGTTKSNLAMARNKLKRMLLNGKEERLTKERNG